MPSLIEQRYGWIATATAINVAWAIFFWLVFFVGMSWHMLQVPMGLGGAVYPALFIVPVLAGSAVYQLFVAVLRKGRVFSTRQVLVLSLWIPFIVIAVCLVIFCPMDTNQSYLGYFWSQLW